MVVKGHIHKVIDYKSSFKANLHKRSKSGMGVKRTAIFLNDILLHYGFPQKWV